MRTSTNSNVNMNTAKDYNPGIGGDLIQGGVALGSTLLTGALQMEESKRAREESLSLAEQQREDMLRQQAQQNQFSQQGLALQSQANAMAHERAIASANFNNFMNNLQSMVKKRDNVRKRREAVYQKYKGDDAKRKFIANAFNGGEQ